MSEIEQVIRSSSNLYVQYTSIVRNYDKEHNVLMQYGYYTNLVTTDTIKSRSSFMIQNTNTGDITQIVNLPLGYKVNDVRFVRLLKNDSVTTEDFCCFCGTRTQFDGIEYLPTPPGEPSQYIELYSKHGFAGFFSMDEALNPSTSYTAKVRDVEKTKELYRMTCYAESDGYYHQNQNIFIDNAVLDIIGLDDTVNKPSCFCRAKFYPRYGTYGTDVRWDNNMRFNNNEYLTDITKTDDYVVTVSHNISGNTQWTRYSGQEDHLIFGGLELNDYVNDVNFNSLRIDDNCNNSHETGYFSRIDNAKVCHVDSNEIAVGFRMYNQGYEGILTSRYNYTNGTMNFLKGSYLKSSPTIEEMIHLPNNDVTAIVYNENLSIPDYVAVFEWNKNKNCNYPVKTFYSYEINVQSITLQQRNGYEHLVWSGINPSDQFSPLFLMTQRGQQGNGYSHTCHLTINTVANNIKLENTIQENQLRIGIRFPYNTDEYPVTFINFNPHEIGKEFQCVK